MWRLGSLVPPVRKHIAGQLLHAKSGPFRSGLRYYHLSDPANWM